MSNRPRGVKVSEFRAALVGAIGGVVAVLIQPLIRHDAIDPNSIAYWGAYWGSVAIGGALIGLVIGAIMNRNRL